MKILGILVALSILQTNTAIAQVDVCRVAYHYWNKETKSGSSRHLVGEFRPLNGDGPTQKEYRDDETGMSIFVGVTSIESSMKGTRRTLRMALSFERTGDDVFEDLSRVDSETILDKNWQWLKVAKLRKLGSKEYTFEFTCERKN